MTQEKKPSKKKKQGSTLCKMKKNSFIKDHLEEYRALVVGAHYLCTKCGRTAKLKKHLCKAIDL